jgi:hypothetical protein
MNSLLFCFTPYKKKNEKRCSEEICIFSGVKNEKKKVQFLEKNRFFTFPFYFWQEKKMKNVEVRKYAS